VLRQDDDELSRTSAAHRARCECQLPPAANISSYEPMSEKCQSLPCVPQQIPSFHSTTSSARPRSVIGTVMPQGPWQCWIDHEFDLGNLLDRQISGLLTFENTAGIDASLPPEFRMSPP
jgi:hypothetical protein